MERREAFRRWLQNETYKRSRRPIPEKLIDGYLRSIHKVSDVMYETGVISKRLYSMRDVGRILRTFENKKECGGNRQWQNTLFEELGGKYERQGDYLIPCLTVPAEEEQAIGIGGNGI